MTGGLILGWIAGVLFTVAVVAVAIDHLRGKSRELDQAITNVLNDDHEEAA